MSKSKFVPSIIIFSFLWDILPEEDVNCFGESRSDYLEVLQIIKRIYNGRKGVRYSELSRRFRDELPYIYGSAYFDVGHYLLRKLRMFA